MITALNSKNFKKIFVGGGRWLTLHRRFLNRLNVYPVPDGDTGTNMSFTVRGALRALKYAHSSEAIGKTAQRAASGALWEAHGNSGVIFSQILHGFACSLNTKNEASIHDLAAALRKSADFAYRALQNPAEGTILSFIRILGERAEKFSIQNEKSDLVSFLHTILTESRYFFDLKDEDDRPEALRQAQAADAGALGLYFFFVGMLRVAQGRSLSWWERDDEEIVFVEKLKESITDSVSFTQAPTYRYCSEFLLTDCHDNIKDKIEAQLAPLGDSLVIAQTPKLLKIHIHTDFPQTISEILLHYGHLVDSKEDDLAEQCVSRRQEILWRKSFESPISSYEVDEQDDRILIVTDSTCDLDPKLLRTLKVISVPLRINLNGRSYLDGCDLNSEQLAELLSLQKEPVEISTAHPSPHDFVSIYRAHPKSRIISLHPSAFLSGSYNAAYQAAISIDPEQKRIKVINSNSISVGLGCLVTEAADFIAANPQANLDEVNTYIKSLTGKIHLLFTVPSLQYLIRGGRLRTPKQKLERLSQAYHIFSYSGENSIAPLARSQNLNKALCDMAQRVKAEDERYKIGKIFIVCSPSLKTVKNANALDTSQAIISLDRELSKLNLPAPIIRTETGCAISVHCGSGAVGLAYLSGD